MDKLNTSRNKSTTEIRSSPWTSGGQDGGTLLSLDQEIDHKAGGKQKGNNCIKDLSNLLPYNHDGPVKS